MTIVTVHSKQLDLHYYDERVSSGLTKRYTLIHAKINMPKKFLLEIFDWENSQYGKWIFFTGSGGFLAPKDPPIESGIIDRQIFAIYDINFKLVNNNDLYEMVVTTLNSCNDLSQITLASPALTLANMPKISSEPVKICNHQWVNCGFYSIKYCCKHCGVDKPNVI